MLSVRTAVTFLATALILFALFYAFTPAETGVAERLEQLKQPTARLPEEKFAEKQRNVRATYSQESEACCQ